MTDEFGFDIADPQPATEDDLDAFLVFANAPADFRERRSEGTFVLENDDLADWAMSALTLATKRAKRVREQAAAKRFQIDRWERSLTAPLDTQADYFTGLLSAYATKVREDLTDGRKTLVFADGTVSTRETNDKIEVTDEKEFFAWCRKVGHPEWIRSKESVNLADLKQAVTINDDGSIVDPVTGSALVGVARVSGGINATVKPAID